MTSQFASSSNYGTSFDHNAVICAMITGLVLSVLSTRTFVIVVEKQLYSYYPRTLCDPTMTCIIIVHMSTLNAEQEIRRKAGAVDISPP